MYEDYEYNTPDIYDNCPIEWITESAKWDDEDWDDEDWDDEDCEDDC